MRVRPVLDEGEPPEARWDWADEVLLFMSPDGAPMEPLELIDRLWAQAWRAGWDACAARQVALAPSTEHDSLTAVEGTTP